ncbi:hypothetical protein [Streptomyces californicus]|uniref:hypothetical protein n=1 Tax=Streptomyces californicus TaxID=67351 RepID=UPI0037AF73B4
MTLSPPPAPAPADPPSQEWEGQAEALARCAAAGRRAVAWVRALPAPPAPTPVWSWLVTDLAGAVETAMGSLDPADCDRMDELGEAVDGTGGMGPDARDMLTLVPCVATEAHWLTPHQQVCLLAIGSAVTGAARLIAQDPASAILHGLLARLCVVLDEAAAEGVTSPLPTYPASRPPRRVPRGARVPRPGDTPEDWIGKAACHAEQLWAMLRRPGAAAEWGRLAGLFDALPVREQRAATLTVAETGECWALVLEGPTSLHPELTAMRVTP